MDFKLWQTLYICLFSHVVLSAGMSRTHFPIQVKVFDGRSKTYSDLPRREIIESLRTGSSKTDGDFKTSITELLLKNVSNKLTDMDLSLFISALIARGQSLNPEGINLVADLRHRVDRNSSPRPYSILTLCNAHAVDRHHLSMMVKLASSGSEYSDNRELEKDALILKALACAASLPNAHSQKLEFRQTMEEIAEKIAHQTNGAQQTNVFTTSLVVQALTSYSIVVDANLQWEEQEKLNFLRKESDTTSLTKNYYVTMALNSRRVPFLKSLHPQAHGSQMAVRRVIKVTLALRIQGNPEMDFAVQMKVPANWNLHEVILKASNLTSRFQLVVSENLKREPMIIELDGIPNDPERGLYWLFYATNGSTSCATSSYIPSDGETVVFFYGSSPDSSVS